MEAAAGHAEELINQVHKFMKTYHNLSALYAPAMGELTRDYFRTPWVRQFLTNLDGVHHGVYGA